MLALIGARIVKGLLIVQASSLLYPLWEPGKEDDGGELCILCLDIFFLGRAIRYPLMLLWVLMR